ncbi:hypothetical protein ABPG75_005977 [Micractinium tetrahymenae]
MMRSWLAAMRGQLAQQAQQPQQAQPSNSWHADNGGGGGMGGSLGDAIQHCQDGVFTRLQMLVADLSTMHRGQVVQIGASAHLQHQIAAGQLAAALSYRQAVQQAATAACLLPPGYLATHPIAGGAMGRLAVVAVALESCQLAITRAQGSGGAAGLEGDISASNSAMAVAVLEVAHAASTLLEQPQHQGRPSGVGSATADAAQRSVKMACNFSADLCLVAEACGSPAGMAAAGELAARAFCCALGLPGSVAAQALCECWGRLGSIASHDASTQKAELILQLAAGGALAATTQQGLAAVQAHMESESYAQLRDTVAATLSAAARLLAEREGCAGDAGELPYPATAEELQARAMQLLPRLEAAAAAGTQERAVQRCLALSQRKCAYLGCTNVALLAGPLPGVPPADAPRPRRCGGCRRVRYCSEECCRADWRAHRRACRALAAQAEAAGQGGEA